MNMSMLIVFGALVACTQNVEPAALTPPPSPEPQTRLVCIDKMTKDGKIVIGKDGKPVQDCRTMRVHKKLDGTPVPKK